MIDRDAMAAGKTGDVTDNRAGFRVEHNEFRALGDEKPIRLRIKTEVIPFNEAAERNGVNQCV